MVRPAGESSKTLSLTLIGIWLSVLCLGSPRIPNSNLIFFVCLIALLCLLLLYFPKRQATKTVQPVVRLFFISAGIASIVLQIISAYTNDYDLYPDLPSLLTLLACFTTLALFGLQANLRAFFRAGSAFLILSWITELLFISESRFESGFSFNLLGHRLTGLAIHPNVIGLLSSIIFCLGVLRYQSLLMSSISLVSIVFSENRGGLLSAILVIFVWLTTAKGNKGKVFRLTSLAGLISSVFLLFGTFRNKADDITSGRLDIWGVCQAKILEGRPFGYGPNTITNLFGLDTVNWFRPFHCHNQFLDDSVNFGLFIGFLNLAITAGLLIYYMKTSQYTLLSLFAIYLLAGIFETPIRLFSSSGFLWINLFFLVLFITGFKNIDTTDQADRGVESLGENVQGKA